MTADGPVPATSLRFLVSMPDDIDPLPDEKGIFRRDGEPVVREIPLADLRANLHGTLAGLDHLFSELPSLGQGLMSLKSVEISFEVTASGKITLLGTGAEVSGKGGITLSFERSG